MFSKQKYFKFPLNPDQILRGHLEHQKSHVTLLGSLTRMISVPFDSHSTLLLCILWHSLSALHQIFFLYLSLLITSLKAWLWFNHICTPYKVYPVSFMENIQFVELTTTVVFLFFQTKVFHWSLSLKLSYKRNFWPKS